jgi:hypothetical protein
MNTGKTVIDKNNGTRWIITAAFPRTHTHMINAIMQYESGEMTPDDIIQFFAELVETGFINAMQGHYQRTAQDLIEGGYISVDGEVL